MGRDQYEQSRHDRADNVGAEHDPAWPELVSENAARGQREDARNAVAREHNAEQGRSSSAREHEPGQGNRVTVVADRRGELPAGEQPEVDVGERASG